MRGREKRVPRAPGRQGSERRETVRIESIAAGGEGVGHLSDGRVVFVHRTAPGDLAEIAVRATRQRWARGKLVRLHESSPNRRDLTCPFYAECGGCTLEHLVYEAQLQAKAGIVTDSFRRIGKRNVETPEVVPSPSEYRYRNRVSFALRRGGRGIVSAGFHRLGSPDEIVDIDDRCLLPEEAISLVWERIRAAWGPDARRLPSGEQLRLTLRATEGGSVSLLIEGGYSSGSPEELLAEVEGLENIWHRRGGGSAELVAGAPGLPETWGDETLELSGTAFLQVNRAAAALLEEHVMQLAGDVSGQRVVDAYCGVGFHARRLARSGATVIGIELDPSAVALAESAAPAAATFLPGQVEELLPAALPADLVLLNPPRAGVDAGVVQAILQSPPARIIYISCDPATLARDLFRLGESFAIESLRCFDLFPQTSHVETVVGLRYEPSAPGDGR